MKDVHRVTSLCGRKASKQAGSDVHMCGLAHDMFTSSKREGLRDDQILGSAYKTQAWVADWHRCHTKRGHGKNSKGHKQAWEAPVQPLL
jgi:hypothetical protein